MTGSCESRKTRAAMFYADPGRHSMADWGVGLKHTRAVGLKWQTMSEVIQGNCDGGKEETDMKKKPWNDGNDDV